MASTAALEIIIKARDDASKVLAGIQGQLKGFGKTATRVGKGLTAGLTLPIVGIGTAAVKMASDLDREMRNIQSISKQTDAEIAALSQTFVGMSTDITVTTDSAAQLADGFYTIQGSGFAGADAMTVLEAATMAASAGLTRTETAAKAITSALNAYGESAGLAREYSDLMFRTVDIGVGTFEELSGSLGYVVGTASQAGVGFDEVSAALSTMSKQGIEFYKGGRALNMLLLSLIKPSDDLSDALLDIGFQSGQTALDTLGLAGTLQALEQAGYGGTEGFAQLGLSSMSLRAALALTGIGAEMFAGDLAAMQAASQGAGAAQEAFAIQTQSFSAQMANFRNNVQAAGIAIGSILLPILSSLLQQVTPLLQRFASLDPAILKIILVVAGLAAALGPLLIIVGQVATAISTLISVVAKIGGVIAALSGPIGWVVAAVVALAVAWATNFGGIREKTAAVIEALKGFFGGLIETLVNLGKYLLAVVQDGDYLNDWLTHLPEPIQGVVQAFGQLVAGIGDFVENAIAWVKEFVAGWGDSLAEAGAVTTAAWQIIRTAIDSAMTAIGAIVNAGLAAVREFWDENHELIRSTAQTIWNTISGLIEIAITYIRDIIVSVLTIIREWWDENHELILSTAQTIWEAIRSFIEIAITNIRDIVTTVLTTIKNWWDTNHELILNTARTIWNAIKTFIEITIYAILTIVTEILSRIKAFWEDHGERIKSIARSAWDIIQAIIDTALNVILGVVRLAMQLITGDWSGAWETIKFIASTIWDGIKTVISAAINIVKNEIQIILTTLQAIWNTAWNAMKSAAISIWNAMKAAISAKMEEIKSTIRAKINAAVNIVRGFVTSFRNAGRAIIEGLIAGVAGMASSLVNKVRGVINDAKNAAKNLLGISCPDPSPVWAELGIAMAEGVGAGWGGTFGGVQKNIAAGITGLIEAMSLSPLGVTGVSPSPISVGGGEGLPGRGFIPSGRGSKVGRHGRRVVPIEIPVYLDGREIARAVKRDIADDLRRQGVII